MKKIGSHISVALVCCLLGFMLTSQFEMLNKKQKNLNANQGSIELSTQIEQYKKQKSDLQKQVNDLQKQIKSYESSAANQSSQSKEILDQLEETRTMIGYYDVTGPGITLYLNPITNGIKSNSETGNQYIIDKDLVVIVNELEFAGAEAISINDERITARTGIRSSSGNEYILINDIKVSPKKQIVIKAIGDKSLLMQALAFPGFLSQFAGYDAKYDKYDNIKILKSNIVQSFKYAKPVQK